VAQRRGPTATPAAALTLNKRNAVPLYSACLKNLPKNLPKNLHASGQYRSIYCEHRSSSRKLKTSVSTYLSVSAAAAINIGLIIIFVGFTKLKRSAPDGGHARRTRMVRLQHLAAGAGRTPPERRSSSSSSSRRGSIAAWVA